MSSGSGGQVQVCMRQDEDGGILLPSPPLIQEVPVLAAGPLQQEGGTIIFGGGSAHVPVGPPVALGPTIDPNAGDVWKGPNARGAILKNGVAAGFANLRVRKPHGYVGCSNVGHRGCKYYRPFRVNEYLTPDEIIEWLKGAIPIDNANDSGPVKAFKKARHLELLEQIVTRHRLAYDQAKAAK